MFKVNTDGTGFSLLHSFVAANGDGWAPVGSLTLFGSTLYGMTRQGGGAAGTIFRINVDGTGYSLFHSFTGMSGGDGANPVGDLLLLGSTLYGTTPIGGPANLGTIFEIGTDGSGYTVLHSFAGGSTDGANPAGLIFSGSSLYGMTGTGGTSNLGTIYSFPISVPEPSTLLLAAGGAFALVARGRSRGRCCWACWRSLADVPPTEASQITCDAATRVCEGSAATTSAALEDSGRGVTSHYRIDRASPPTSCDSRKRRS